MNKCAGGDHPRSKPVCIDDACACTRPIGRSIVWWVAGLSLVAWWAWAAYCVEPSFVPFNEFAGVRPGYVFKMDVRGLGYYRDEPLARA